MLGKFSLYLRHYVLHCVKSYVHFNLVCQMIGSILLIMSNMFDVLYYVIYKVNCTALCQVFSSVCCIVSNGISIAAQLTDQKMCSWIILFIALVCSTLLKYDDCTKQLRFGIVHSVECTIQCISQCTIHLVVYNAQKRCEVYSVQCSVKYTLSSAV